MSPNSRLLVLSDDDDDEIQSHDKDCRTQATVLPGSIARPSMVLKSKDYLSDDAYEVWLRHRGAEEKCPSISRFPSPQPKTILEKYVHNGILLNPGVCIELMDGDFLKILEISQDPTTGAVILSGWLFRRMMYMNGIIEKKMNEVCWILHVNESDDRSPEIQGLHSVNVQQVVKRRSLKLTNRPFPELSFRDEARSENTADIIKNHRLVCRWQYRCSYANSAAQKKNSHSEKSLTRLRSTDCTYGCDDNNLRDQWRGESIRGGASSSISTLERARDEDEHRRAQTAKDRVRCERPETIPQPRGYAVPTPVIDLTVNNKRNDKADTYKSRLKSYSDTRLPKRRFTGSLKDREDRQVPQGLASQVRYLETSDECDELPEPYPVPSSPTDSDSTIGKERSRSPSVLIYGENSNGSLPATKDQYSSALSKPNPRKVVPTMKMAEITAELRRYTFGDGFCGCGGISRGAKQAGVCLRWAFDYARDMCRSYEVNFPYTLVKNVSAFRFATMKRIWIKVDILHLSPPCQFFSPAHTTVGQHDDLNTASSFCISLILKLAKPRIVTLENTLGLEQRHPLYLNAVIQQFTALNFSVRWKILDLRDFGVPQMRRRLIIVASCPGEVLPEFPRPTHAKNPGTSGLKPWATINESIDAIPRSWPNHDIDNASLLLRAPYDGNTQATCITTGGGEKNYHPSGKRHYTIRELASLQTFPLEHNFAQVTKTTLKKQVGNAVPPIFAHRLMETVVKALRKADGLPEEVPVADVEERRGGNTQSVAGLKRKFELIELD